MENSVAITTGQRLDKDGNLIYTVTINKFIEFNTASERDDFITSLKNEKEASLFDLSFLGTIFTKKDDV